MAGFALELGYDGRVIRQGSLNEILRSSSLLQEEVRKDKEMLENTEASIKEDTTDRTEQSSTGKLIIAEEIALGRVAWPAIKLYTHSVGGLVFWILFLCGVIVSVFLGIFEVWFLGYWASQYSYNDPAL